MDKFIVSARKYRPQNFSTVVGQAHITTTLKNAIRQQQLAHAFLFCGPRGVGKTTCARILAKTINCENLQEDGEACNQCQSCVSFNEGSSLNIHELDAASNNSVEDIRALTEQVRFAPQAGKYKVYIIDEVHMLSSSAFNAFLKTLEEPPPYAIFILATTEKHKILPTILSRCQIFDFKRITTEDTVSHLQEICEKETIDAERSALQVIAQKSEGCMRDALSILDKIVSFTGGHINYGNTLEHLNILDEDVYFRILDAMTRQDLASALLIYDEVNRKGFEGDTVLGGLSEFFRNLLVCQDERVASLLEVVEGFREKYRQASSALSTSFLIGALNILGEAEIGFRMARNKRLHVEMALIKLVYLAQAIELSDNHGALQKKKVTDEIRPLQFRQVSYSLNPRELKSRPDSSTAALARAGIPVATPQPVHEAPVTAIPQPATGGAKMVIEEPPAAKLPLNSLRKIREQVNRDKAIVTEVKPLSLSEAEAAWDAFISQLTAQKNHSAVTNFRLAQLRILDSSTLEIKTETNIQQKFIEQERAALIDHLQAWFNNKTLTYSVMLEETPEASEPAERPLSTREQFQKMSEEFPLLKELKDRLRLDLNY